LAASTDDSDNEMSNKLHALVVDDSRVTRTILSRVLTGLGIEVTTAPDGVEALSILEAPPAEFNLALVDWNMPRMDGLALVEAIRKDSRWAALKIMMVTTESEMERIVRALDAGANEYLMKPFTPEAVSEKLAILGLTSSSQ